MASRPFSIQKDMKAKLAEDGKTATTERRMALENGHPGVAVDEAAIRRGENIYSKYYQQQGEHPLPSSQVSLLLEPLDLGTKWLFSAGNPLLLSSLIT